jgi:hypothetical protein
MNDTPELKALIDRFAFGPHFLRVTFENQNDASTPRSTEIFQWLPQYRREFWSMMA